MRLLKLTLLLVPLFSNIALANNNFGLGIVLGDPTGITAKYVLGRANAIDSAISFGSGNNFYLHSSYLWLKPKVFDINRYPVTWYFGIGPRLISHDHGHGHDHGPFGHHHHDGDHEDDLHLAARAPIGLRMNFTDPRIELFGEISLAMDIIPDMDVDLDFGIGARYYF